MEQAHFSTPTPLIKVKTTTTTTINKIKKTRFDLKQPKFWTVKFATGRASVRGVGVMISVSVWDCSEIET